MPVSPNITPIGLHLFLVHLPLPPLQANILAARTVTNILRTSLGPKGEQQQEAVPGIGRGQQAEPGVATAVEQGVKPVLG